MARGKTLLPGIALIFALVAVLPAALGDRSPYVPDPVTYPGLLPQFTSTTAAPPAVGGGGEHHRPAPPKPATPPRPQGGQRPRPSTTTTEHATTIREEVGEGEDNDLGDRIGEENTEEPSRPQRPQRPQQPCEPQPASVPCHDCVVYISRTGQITRFYPSRGHRDD